MTNSLHPSWAELNFKAPGNEGIHSLISGDGDNPWMTLGIMDNIEDEDLLVEWDALLDVQTRLLASREIDWMRSKGLGAEGAGILEIGSANGNYGSRLASDFPESTLFGVEANPHLAARLDAATCPDNYSITVCKVGEEPLPGYVQSEFRQCVLRFVSQHVSDPLKLLRAVYESLPAGGSLYIIEEDDALFNSYPPSSNFETAFDIWRRVTAAGGSNSKIGRELPSLVERAGFTIASFEIALRNNIEAGCQFNEFFASATKLFLRTNPSMVSEEDLKTVLEGLSDFRSTRGVIATYPQFLLHARKE
ncbi:methyltransferase domain-containing protein [Streptomyces sp. NPDC015127]|uniref:methyltransferase domain-containing protein n=1 Tax=Streptomyces sp. NPDC015127 TaxID=3364939 RepID=UPI0036FCAA6E